MTNYTIFAEHFKRFQDNYVVIGGTACEIALKQLGENFRSTQDIDMILVAEELDESFGQVFWDFIRKGGYASHISETAKNYYRFTEPTEPNYPKWIELFCQKPIEDYRTGDLTFTPIYISEEIKSLSAIVLNDEYYELLIQGKTISEGLTILKAEYLVLFKARAHIDLKHKKTLGELVKTDDIRKHLKDVITLLDSIDIDKMKDDPFLKELDVKVKDDLQKFILEVESESSYIEGLSPKEYTNEPDLIIENVRELFSIK